MTLKPDIAALRKITRALAFLAFVAVIVTFWGQTYWLNFTDSEPRGLYRYQEFGGRLTRGELVIMEIPREFQPYVYGRRWLPAGWTLLKNVGAIAGDSYCITDSAVSINGRIVGPVYLADSQGLPLPRLRGCRQIPPGHFLPIATRISRSFDGRYMGPVPITLIKGIAKPILTE